MEIDKLQNIAGALQIRAPSHGPRVVIFGGIHGDETSGVHALEALLFDFLAERHVLTKGSLILVRANERALLKGKRYLDYDLNRLFKEEYPDPIDRNSYEFERAQQLKLLLERCEYFLDLHSAPIAQDPFIVAERQPARFFIRLGIPRIITGWGKFAGTSIGGDAENYANNKGAAAATLEAGNHLDSSSIKVAYNALLSMLSLLEMIKQSAKTKSLPVEVYEIYAVQQKEAEDFRYVGTARNFQFIPQGVAYAFQRGEPLTVTKDSFLLIPMRPEETKMGAEVCYLGERVETGNLITSAQP